ncbi:MAG: 3D domain-containing protein [Bacteroidales bacterium]
MLIAKSLRRKVVATLVVLAGFVVFYQATIFDSRFSTHQLLEGSGDDAAARAPAPPPPGSTRSEVVGTPAWMLAPAPSLRFVATAYCKGSTTASGVIPRTGIAAADQDLLPVGSVIQIGSLGPRYDGVYTIMDTGPKVQGRNVDLYLWSCDEAIRFGRRAVTVVVLRLGWNPRDTEPTLVDRLLDWGGRALPGRRKPQ